jgi:hypothetical protein
MEPRGSPPNQTHQGPQQDARYATVYRRREADTTLNIPSRGLLRRGVTVGAPLQIEG